MFEQFLRERTYLKNGTPRTIVGYRVAFQSYVRWRPGDAAQVHQERASNSSSIGFVNLTRSGAFSRMFGLASDPEHAPSRADAQGLRRSFNSCRPHRSLG